MTIPLLDISLIARAETAATGATIHDLNGILGCYRGSHRRLKDIAANPKLGEMLAGEIDYANEQESRLRTFIARANAARVV